MLLLSYFFIDKSRNGQFEISTNIKKFIVLQNNFGEKINMKIVKFTIN